ncbi:hypothetical protein BC940DRAFT_99058 [Gongronella butleri]|nr:hypothetical protein BC940DRAFT_99058 [Gongronella butleri]
MQLGNLAWGGRCRFLMERCHGITCWSQLNAPITRETPYPCHANRPNNNWILGTFIQEFSHPFFFSLGSRSFALPNPLACIPWYVCYFGVTDNNEVILSLSLFFFSATRGESSALKAANAKSLRFLMCQCVSCLSLRAAANPAALLGVHRGIACVIYVHADPPCPFVHFFFLRPNLGTNLRTPTANEKKDPGGRTKSMKNFQHIARVVLAYLPPSIRCLFFFTGSWIL